MKRYLFNDGWNFINGSTSSLAALMGAAAKPVPVTLPHDALIGTERVEDQSLNPVAFYKGTNVGYTKDFELTEECLKDKTYILEFEGVYQIGMLYVNNAFVGECKYGYGNYYHDITNYLKPGKNTIKMTVKNGVYAENGGVYYYENGALSAAGLVKVDGYYYYVSTGGECKTGKYWVSRTNGLLSAGYYYFDEVTARMDIKNGVYAEDGGIYYYVDGVRTGAGLVEVDGYYYYASTGGACKTGKYWVSRTNGLMAAGYYTFGEDGKMVI